MLTNPSHSPSERIIVGLTVLLLTGTVVLVAALIWRTASARAPAARGELAGSWPTNYDAASVRATMLGEARGELEIVEFSDFQCPYCAVAAHRLDEFQGRHPGRATIRYAHLPQDGIHPHAREAAIAAECAGLQGRFKQYHDALFRAQTTIGLRPWTVQALVAGVQDTVEFKRCMKDELPAGVIAQSSAAAAAMHIRGTPSFLVRGVVYEGVPSATAMDSWLK